MSKKKQTRKSRDAPAEQSRSAAWMCSPAAYDLLVGDGYTKLSNCPEVRMCVHKYADLISSMTIHLMQNTEKGDVRVKNGLSRKVDIEPYALMTRKRWMYNIVQTMMLEGDGNQITYPRYSPDGYLESLMPLKPSRVSLVENGDSYLIRYNGDTFRPEEVLHFAINPDPDAPWRGTGYRAVLRDVINGLKQASATRQGLMSAPTPSVIVKVDGLTEEFGSPEGRKRLREKYVDASEKGEPWIIPAEMLDVKTVRPLTMNDLAIKDGMELDKRVVAGIFDMPAFIVGVGEYNKDAYNNFISTAVHGKADEIQQEMTRKLLFAPDLYWKFNQRSLMAYDIKEIIQAGAQMVDRMSMRRNEWRDWIGVGPDSEMEELLALENYVPADRLGDQEKLQGGSAGDERDFFHQLLRYAIKGMEAERGGDR